MPERGLRGDALVGLPVHPGAHLQLRRLRERHRSHRLLCSEDNSHILYEHLTQNSVVSASSMIDCD